MIDHIRLQAEYAAYRRMWAALYPGREFQLSGGELYLAPPELRPVLPSEGEGGP